MRCRLRVAEPFTGEKVTLCFVTRFALHLITACGRSFPSEGKPRKVFAAGCLTVRALTCPRCAACTESSPLLPHAVVVSLLTAGVKGASPCSSFFFPFFFLRRKKKRVGTDAVAKSLFEKQNPTSTQLPTNQHHHNHPIGGKNEYRNNRTSQRDQFRL